MRKSDFFTVGRGLAPAEIEDRAFENCFRLRTVVFSENLKKIGSGAFNDCDSLGTRTIAKIEKISDNAFCGKEWD